MLSYPTLIETIDTDHGKATIEVRTYDSSGGTSHHPKIGDQYATLHYHQSFSFGGKTYHGLTYQFRRYQATDLYQGHVWTKWQCNGSTAADTTVTPKAHRTFRLGAEMAFAAWADTYPDLDGELERRWLRYQIHRFDERIGELAKARTRLEDELRHSREETV